MSLRPVDPRRTRSKSPGGKIRERSQSRNPRGRTQSVERTRRSSAKYYEPTSRLTNRVYDNHGSEAERYQHTLNQRNPPGHYYVSDEEDVARRYPGDRLPERHRYEPTTQYQRQYAHPAGYDDYESDLYTDTDDDDALAYGDSYYESPPSRYQQARQSLFHSGGPGGNHPHYAQPQPYTYADTTPYYQGQQNNRYGETHPHPSDWAPVPECERPDFVPPIERTNQRRDTTQPGYTIPLNAYTAASSAAAPVAGVPVSNVQYASVPHQPTTHPYPQIIPQGTGTYIPSAKAKSHNRAQSAGPPTISQEQRYASPPPYQYAQPNHNIRYISKSSKPYTMTAEPQFEMKPKKIPDRPQSASGPPKSSNNNLMSVPGGFPDPERPPASPLLEPYRGTYQSISPVPWPSAPPSDYDDELSDLEPLDGGAASNSDHGKSTKDRSLKVQKKGKQAKFGKVQQLLDPVVETIPTDLVKHKRVTFYDAKPDAKDIHAAISRSRIDSKTLITILPYLNSDEILKLRAEYKSIVKVGRKGVNVAKHIKAQIPGNFGKVCYATALGRWESEAHWANFWYRSNSTRRELLIESLIGRTNSELREIKNAFRDKRYGDDLEKCMKAELKADKFRVAILLALEERRQSETAPLDEHLIRSDVKNLHRALISHEGGETAMINIIVLRSDKHLREVLHQYEYIYRSNFAKDMITKSRNLVVSTVHCFLISFLVLFLFLITVILTIV